MPNRAQRSWGYAVGGGAAIVGLLGLASIATITWAQEAAPSAFDFDEPKVSFHGRFPGARLNDCVQVTPAEYRVTILPENTPINNSAWYAFQVTSDVPRTITVRLTYRGGSHRYHPKISHDGLRWTPLDPQRYSPPQKGQEATLRLDVGPEPLWVAGQELITSRELNLWADKMARLPFVEKSVIGSSVLEQPIHKLQTAGAEKPGCVFLIGRQHPPEVTGSLALMKFVETLFGESDLARRFRERFNVIVVPLMNPDGVDAGHWRHNANGVDLNRDWDRFDQPETRAVRDEILRFKSASEPRLFLFLDFHSTHRDVFYTQPDHLKTNPEGFTRKWLEAVQQRFSDYRVRRVGSHGSALKTSRALTG
jgi:murein tripeptide amidase MpaA